MKSRTLLYLGAVVVLVAGLGWLIHSRFDDRPSAHNPTALTERQADSVGQIRIEYRDGEIIGLYKERDGWRINQPVSAPANDERVARLLQLTKAGYFDRRDAQGKDLARFQLDAPHLRVSLDDLELAFGGVEPASGRRYVLLGNAVYLISERDYQNARPALAELVSPLLLPPGFGPVQISMPGVSMARGDPGWQAGLADEWRRARAFRVEGWSADSRAIGEIIVRLDPAAEFHFEIIATGPELILARRDIGMQYRLTRDQAQRLLPSLATNNGRAP